MGLHLHSGEASKEKPSVKGKAGYGPTLLCSVTPGFSALLNGQERVQSTDLDSFWLPGSIFPRKPSSVSFLFPALQKQCSKSCRSDCSCHLQGKWSGGQTLSAVLQKMQTLGALGLSPRGLQTAPIQASCCGEGWPFQNPGTTLILRSWCTPSCCNSADKRTLLSAFILQDFSLPLPKTSRTPSQNC